MVACVRKSFGSDRKFLGDIRGNVINHRDQFKMTAKSQTDTLPDFPAQPLAHVVQEVVLNLSRATRYGQEVHLPWIAIGQRPLYGAAQCLFPPTLKQSDLEAFVELARSAEQEATPPPRPSPDTGLRAEEPSDGVLHRKE